MIALATDRQADLQRVVGFWKIQSSEAIEVFNIYL